MNELISNIYYVFKKGSDAEMAESDTFFNFVILMRQTQDK